MNRRARCVSLLAFTLALLLAAATAFASGPRETLLYSFQGPTSANSQDGQNPASLIADENGNLYGVTSWGGICNMGHHLSYPCGTVFELSPPSSTGGAWTETVLYEFGTLSADARSRLETWFATGWEICMA